MKKCVERGMEFANNKFMSLSTICIIILSSLVLIAGVIVARDYMKPDGCLDESFFINPRFACGDGAVINKGEYRELRTQLETYIAGKKAVGELTEISVYFRDLESGPTMGINERKDFIPASLLKLPLAMAYYSMEEDKRIEDLKHTLVYNGSIELSNQTFDPKDPIEKGKEYTVERLIEHMIVYSDNVAAQAIFEHLIEEHGRDYLLETYRNLGIIDVGSNLNMEAVNAKGYSSIFRQLYNSSYLNPEYSEKLLKLLVESKFHSGLVAGVPNGIPVANKFGERYFDNGEKHLHDCGIIYYPQNPYVLCVMTRGYNFDVLESIIAEISGKVYQEVDSRRIEY